MKKVYLLAIATAAVLVGCSSNDVVNDIPGSKTREVPIGFSVQKQNITRADTKKLEDINHYNFGVFAWKVNGKDGLADQLVMDNYLVGFGGTNVGYDHTNATTWKDVVGSKTDHTSPWFYEGLGTDEYKTAATGFYQPSQSDYMSKNANQYLRYWDLSYKYTNFYCYAPYNKEVEFDKANKKMTFDATKTIRDGYEEPVNTSYAGRSLTEYMYATGIQKENAKLEDVDVEFKHMGAQLFIRFHENIPGYKVEIIDLGADKGKFKDGTTDDMKKGIQAAPSKDGSSTDEVKYYTTNGATITFDDNANATFSLSQTGATEVGTPLMFMVPEAGKSTASVAPANLEDFTGLNSTTHKVIPHNTTTGSGAKYSYSPTIYYPVAQPTTSETGFTFHISYRIIAEDNKEVITVHNATVFVPAKSSDNTTYIAAWQPNVKYTYTFLITKNSAGTTNFETEIDPTSPVVSDKKGLYPIVFDNVTIEDYTDNNSEYVVSDKTSY